MELSLTNLKGSAQKCGEIYGEQFDAQLRGFCVQEVTPTPKRLLFAKQCWKQIEKFAPDSAAFLRGMARGSSLSLDQLVLISLHEEIYHQKNLTQGHCTAIAATREATRGAKTIIAQNWDWPPSMYPWPGMLKFAVPHKPEVISYHFPGLWTCCGLNSSGLSLMWTGGGYFPVLEPRVGVPSYILISEILSKKTVPEAIAYLERVPFAGTFMFFLADAHKQIALIEAVPGEMEVIEEKDILYRANLFCCPEIIRASKQQSNTKKLHSPGRMKGMDSLIRKYRGKITLQLAKEMLSDPRVFVDIGLESLTIDQLAVDCDERTLDLRRGGDRSMTKWKRYSF